MAEKKETQRKKLLKSRSYDDKTEDHSPEHGAVMLGEASKAILMKWCSTARENVFGKDGRSRDRVSIEDISDDDEEDSQYQWVDGPLELSDRTAFIATYWLRSARAKVQNDKLFDKVTTRRGKF